ncbi:DNA polymerase III subunit gamma and tau [Brachybacterium tyrofermentans]|uniref:DNA polymerase III subunit gamma and tau n=1 Tax=Brachybacterium tyrofermentans TaxID=47848 RepID=UPI003FD03A73
MATALYRRYRPESFAEVIGQDHVTTPLQRALRAGRIGHAYLFSGPRGCGKTTSARILARCLNCAEGPTDIPCGQCDSCRDLANGGAGSLDVVEIDAASHGGVDDARELRERASFAPVRDRYKVFIIDEAHMVTSAGFNALLKLVEEPPDHVKFVFATTEPDKVIGTIRSRTHHYPFRLIPPQVLGPYLEEVCVAEGVNVGEGVMPLVVRAGGGSARDSMSVLDQLMAGAGEDGLDFPTAIALLGFTDTALLDSAITAVAERDAGALYAAVEHVLATGHEPRRFVEDLLERMRDLIILAAVPDRGQDLLPQVPADELERMVGQAGRFEPADLSQCGDLVHETLSTMSGATSPRLHLELLAARLVLRDERAALAAAGDGSAPAGRNQPAGGQPLAGGRQGAPGRGAQAPSAGAGAAVGGSSGREEARRIAQEKAESARQSRGGRTPAPSTERQGQPQAPDGRADAATSSQGWDTPVSRPGGGPLEPGSAPQAAAPQGASPQGGAPQGGPQSGAAQEQPPAPQQTEQRAASQQAAPQHAAPQASAPQSAPAPAAPDAGGAQGLNADAVREHWSAILDELAQIRRPSWALVGQNGHVHGSQGSTLLIGFRTEGLVAAFHRGTAAENLADAVRRIMHVEISVDAVVGEDPGPGGSGPGSSGPGSSGPGSAGPGSSGPGTSGPGSSGLGSSGPGSSGPGGTAGGAPRGAGGPQDGAGQQAPSGSGQSGSWEQAVGQDGSGGGDDGRGAAGQGGAAPSSAPVPWGDAVAQMAPPAGGAATAASAAPTAAPAAVPEGPGSAPSSASAPSAAAAPSAPTAPGGAPAPGGQAPSEEPPASAGQRAADRAMQAAARASRGRAAAPGGADRVEEFAPEPDDPYPPDPEDSYPPDDYSAQSAPVARHGGGPQSPASSPERTPRWSDALQPGTGSSAPAPQATSAGSASESAPAPSAGTADAGEIPVVDDDGRDSLPADEPRTFGQNALKQAIAEGRVVHSRVPRPDATPDAPASSTDPIDPPNGPDQGLGGTSGQEQGEGLADSAESAVGGQAPEAPSEQPASADSASESASGSATARAAASWGTATVAVPGSGQSGPSGQDSSGPHFSGQDSSGQNSTGQGGPSAIPTDAVQTGTAPTGAAPAGAPARSGAALVREAAQASRTAGLRTRGNQGGPEEPPVDADPTGGATRDDDDAVVSKRNGREVIETILGGKVLEVIDETDRY